MHSTEKAFPRPGNRVLHKAPIRYILPIFTNSYKGAASTFVVQVGPCSLRGDQASMFVLQAQAIFSDGCPRFHVYAPDPSIVRRFQRKGCSSSQFFPPDPSLFLQWVSNLQCLCSRPKPSPAISAERVLILTIFPSRPKLFSLTGVQDSMFMLQAQALFGDLSGKGAHPHNFSLQAQAIFPDGCPRFNLSPPDPRHFLRRVSKLQRLCSRPKPSPAISAERVAAWVKNPQKTLPISYFL